LLTMQPPPSPIFPYTTLFRSRTSEALGVCFLEKRAYVVAESILRRGLDLPASGDQERLGVLYWLGRALEELGKKAEARELYGRVDRKSTRLNSSHRTISYAVC